MRKLFVILMSVSLCVSMALAQDLAELTRKADQGDVDAQYDLGKLYFLGNTDVKQDRGLAHTYFAKAFDGYAKRFQDGDLEAAYLLGIMYLNGFGVNTDAAEAVAYIRLAAENQHEVAQLAIANLILLGSGGLSKNYEEAFNWALRSAEQGYLPAYNRLGSMYMRGLGTDKDVAKGLEYYTKAAEAGDVGALYQLGECYFLDKEVAQDYVRALSYWQKAADLEHSPSQNMLGVLYFEGLGTAQNYEKAYELFTKASLNGELMAFYNLGYAFYHGYGTDQNYDRALPLFERLLATGRPQPQYMVGLMYVNGEGVTQNYSKAYEILELAASHKYLPAQYLLGKMYYNGTGLEKQDSVRAYIWLKAAQINAEAYGNAPKMVGVWVAEDDLYLKTYRDAKLLNELQTTIPDDRMAVAAFNLGLMYQRGIGFSTDKTQALNWYLVGKAYGHAGSASAVERLEPSLKPEELALAQKQAAVWLQQYTK